MVAKKDRKKPKSQLLTTVLHIAAFVTVFGLGFLMVGQALEVIESSPYFKLREVTFHGIEHGESDQLKNLVVKNFPSQILEIDLESVRILVESETWIKSALVRRKLPDQLIIYVSERKPTAVAAIDKELYIVDEEGIILDDFGPNYEYLDRPIVRGLQNIARENAIEENSKKIQIYLEVLADLRVQTRDYSELISEIDVQNPDRVAVYPADDPVAIYLGNQSFGERYGTFLSQKQLYLDLKKKYGSIEYIDMTYEDRIIFHTPDETISG
jgi:cell division septal protein FtsQ